MGKATYGRVIRDRYEKVVLLPLAHFSTGLAVGAAFYRGTLGDHRIDNKVHRCCVFVSGGRWGEHAALEAATISQEELDIGMCEVVTLSTYVCIQY